MLGDCLIYACMPQEFTSCRRTIIGFGPLIVNFASGFGQALVIRIGPF